MAAKTKLPGSGWYNFNCEWCGKALTRWLSASQKPPRFCSRQHLGFGVNAERRARAVKDATQ